MAIKLECVHVDTCIPSYWSGHHRPHVQIGVWHGMKLREIKDAIRYELRQGAVMGSGDDARLLSADFVGENEVKRSDALTRAAHAAVNRISGKKKGQRTFFHDLEKQTDDDCRESVYAFFVFVEAAARVERGE